MAARLGEVLYWLGCLAALVCVAFGVVMVKVTPNDANAMLVLTGVPAVGCWLLGWALRYVLRG